MAAPLSGYAAAGPLVLCRSARLARTLRARAAGERLAAGSKAWLSPDIFPIDAYLRRAWERFAVFDRGLRLLSDIESRYVFQRVVADVAPAELAATAVATADALLDAYRLAASWCIDSAQLRAMAYTADERLLASAAVEYDARLSQQGWVDSSMLLRLLVEQPWPRVHLPLSGVELAGFIGLTPAQERLFEHWREHGCEVHRPTAAAIAHCQPTLTRPDDDTTELLAAGAWARQQLERDPDAAVAIVVPGLATAADRLAATLGDALAPAWQLDPDHVDWHVSFGRPLLEFPLLAAWWRPLAARGEPMSFADLSALLRDPLLLPEPALAEFAVIERQLRDRPERHWRVADLLGFAAAGSTGRQVLDELVAVEAQLRDAPTSASPRDWASRFATLTERIKQLNPLPLTSVQFQLNDAWRDSLNALASLDGVAASMSQASALAAWRRLLRGTLFQTQDTGARVDVLGALEAVGHRYDAIWVTRLDDDHWPPLARANPYINRRLQIERGMPGVDRSRDLAFTDALLAHLLSTAEIGVISAPLRINEVDVRLAPVVRRRWPDTQEVPMTVRSRYGPRYATDAIAHVDEAVPIAPDEAVTGGVGVLQATLSSPFRALVGYRLGGMPLPAAVSGFGALNRGQLVHRVAELVYLPVRDGQRMADATDVVASVMQRYRGHGDRVLHRLLDMEERRCTELIEDLVRFDAQRPAFRIGDLERPIELRLGGLTLNLRIDRLDYVGDYAVLVDYKTGSVPVTGMSTDTHLPHELQLAAYALARRQLRPHEQPGVLATVRLHTRGVQANGIAFTPDLVPLTKQIQPTESAVAVIDRWAATLADLAAQFERGDARVEASEIGADDWFHWRPVAGDVVT